MTRGTLLPQVTDAALLQRIGAARDKDAFAELFRRHQRAFYSLAYRLTGHRENAEEAVQDAAYRIWRSALRFRPDGNARAWMFRIVARSSFRRSERKAREISLHEEENMLPENPVAVQPGQQVEQTELVRHLQCAVDRLPRSDQRIVSLYFGVGMTQREVSETLDIPQTTVSYRLGQILKDLRNDLSVAGFAAALPMLDGGILGQVALDGHEAPAEFLENVVARLDAAAKNSVRVATASTGWPTIWGAILILALGIAGFFMGRPDTDSLAPVEESKASANDAKSAEAPMEVAQPAPWKRTWDFNKDDGAKGLRIIKGAWRWAPNDGPDGSGCMETTEEKVSVGLKLPAAKLPLLLTVNFLPVLPEPLGGHLCSGGFYPYDQAAVFHNIGSPIRVASGRPSWLVVRIFLADGVADIWSGGRRTSLVAFENPDRQSYYLLFRGRQRLDNIQIQEIGQEQLPDISQYLDALRKIPPAKKTGTIPVPELESVIPGKQVSISFSNFYSGNDGKHGRPDR